jgi:hypothetical protein
MAKLDWIILCERAMIEAQTNIVSITGIVENVVIGVPPSDMIPSDGKLLAVPFKFYIVAQWTRSKLAVAEAAPGRFLFKGPDKKQHGHMDFIVDLTNTPRARVISLSMGFPMAGAGDYTCVVQMKRGKAWHTAGSASFTVIFAAQNGGSEATKH